MIPQQTPHEWSTSALLNKAQLYAETMVSFRHDDWRFILWSTLSLELLGRAALSSVNPALLADAKAHWNNLLYSLGYEPKTPNFSPRAIDISEVFKRLQELIQEFTPELERFCRGHMAKRNEELHSGATPFQGVQETSWLPTYYQACSVLLVSMNDDLERFFGSIEADLAEKMIEAQQDESAKSVRQAINAHRQVWEVKDSEEKEQLNLHASTWATRQDGHRVSCPSCNRPAIVSGSPIAAPTKSIVDDEITETQQYLPSRFECVACGLKISGLSRLSAADLGDTYNATFTYDFGVYLEEAGYYPEDYYGDYEPDFNEP